MKDFIKKFAEKLIEVDDGYGEVENFANELSKAMNDTIEGKAFVKAMAEWYCDKTGQDLNIHLE